MPRKFKTGLLAYFLFPMAVFGREDRPIGGDSTASRNHHKVAAAKVQYGVGSYYANKFEGRLTYTDEVFRQKRLTAASNTLPMHTWVKITNLHNHRTVIVQINDKMHPKNHRLIDMSQAAARKLGFLGHGLTRVKVEVLGRKRPADAEPDPVDDAPGPEIEPKSDSTSRPQ